MKFTSRREEYGAGEEGTKKLVKRYKKDTPGEEVKEVYADSGLGKWFGKGGKGGTTKGGWDRYNTKGEKIGKCGDRKASEGKPKCLSAAKAAKMSKKEIANAVRRKRKADPSTDRPGTGNKPINVSNRIGEEKNPRIPRKPGQPANSKKHSDLYPDENPKRTIHGLGFKDVATAKASVSKIKKSDRTHAHKIQAAVAMEQRAREMGKSSEAAVYRSYIDSMKKKTKQRNEDWSDKYKRSIDCDNPKGFSQKAHCAGREKNEETTMKSFKSYIIEASEQKEYDVLDKMNPEPSAKEMDAALRDKEHDKKLDAIRAKKKKLLKEKKPIKEEDWQKINRKDKTDGLSQKAVDAYRRENPGSKLQTAVTEKKPKGKRAARRKSFCSRMKGMKAKLTSAKTRNDPDSRINKALRRWNC